MIPESRNQQSGIFHVRNWFIILKIYMCSVIANQKEVCCIVIHMHLEAEFTEQ